MTYYTHQANEFFANTVNVNMDDIYNRFVPLIPSGGHILDAGCGSGRDALFFAKQNFEVTAFDASAELVKKAQAYTNMPIGHRRFEDVSEQAVYDAIWTCASLLHVEDQDWSKVLNALTNALKPQSVWYMSFKLGTESRWKDGRFFKDHNESTLEAHLARRDDLVLVETWRTSDQRPNRAAEQWLNAIVRRI